MKEIDLKTDEGLEIYRHSASHVMAMAVKELFPAAKLAIGPAISDGFYYDFELPSPLTPSDLQKIEDKMEEIISKDILFEKEEVPKSQAINIFTQLREIYKIELINEIPDEKVILYRNDGFVDLCRGPHLQSTGAIKAFKLLDIAGAYWRGDEHNKMLQRIYGTAFPDKKQLDDYIRKLEEAKKRDHRKLGKELDLYSLHEDAGPGLIYWHPKGARVRNIIEEFWKKEHFKRGYDIVYIPHIAKVNLWKTSGHWDNYRENMYSPIQIDEDQFILKPMNCPGHILMYKTAMRSYRDLPLRWAELGTVYRYERSGVLHGMMRVRGFTQDDAHIFCTPEQIKDEILGVLQLADFMMKTFGFEYEVFLSTQPEKFIGSPENWEKATSALKEALEKLNIKYTLDPGAGVFYGPKIDIKLIDALGRKWQGPTIQVDFNLPERFKVDYIAADGKEHQAVMIHRTVLGSMERFMGVLIEHYGGKFPLWLAPVQVAILTITSAQEGYALKLKEKLLEKDIRVEINTTPEKINAKIRDAEMQKIPYMAIVGDKEISQNMVALRKQGKGNIGVLSAEDFIKLLLNEIEKRESAPSNNEG